MSNNAFVASAYRLTGVAVGKIVHSAMVFSAPVSQIVVLVASCLVSVALGQRRELGFTLEIASVRLTSLLSFLFMS